MSHQTPQQPRPGELMARYLSQQADAHRAGLANLDIVEEVLPFDAAPVQRVEPRTAWQEGLVCVPFLAGDVASSAWKPLPEWAQLVASQEPVVALAFCMGNYPQMLRDLHQVLHTSKLPDLKPRPGRAIDAADLIRWARQAAEKQRFPEMILGLAGLRLAKHFDLAADYLRDHAAAVPQQWQRAWANERAAVAWHRGDADQALADWRKQEDSAPVLFNRGMALLFEGKPAEARNALTAAVAQLPEGGAWHHLGKLYLALAA